MHVLSEQSFEHRLHKLVRLLQNDILGTLKFRVLSIDIDRDPKALLLLVHDVLDLNFVCIDELLGAEVVFLEDEFHHAPVLEVHGLKYTFETSISFVYSRTDRLDL